MVVSLLVSLQKHQRQTPSPQLGVSQKIVIPLCSFKSTPRKVLQKEGRAHIQALPQLLQVAPLTTIWPFWDSSVSGAGMTPAIQLQPMCGFQAQPRPLSTFGSCQACILVRPRSGSVPKEGTARSVRIRRDPLDVTRR